MNSISIKQLRVISAALLLAGLSGAAIADDVRSGARGVNEVFGRASAIPAPTGSVKLARLTVDTQGRGANAEKPAGTTYQVARSGSTLVGDFGRGTPNLAIAHKGGTSGTLAAGTR